MAKKNWIFIKRGLSEDPKHRESMGMAVWLFMHICDVADWETGIVYDWRDKDEANDMSVNVRTMRDWRQQLQTAGYITCQQELHKQKIIIHNWNNPREYSGKTLNVRDSDTISAPLEKSHGDTHDDTHGDTHDTQKPLSPDSSSTKPSSSSGYIYDPIATKISELKFCLNPNTGKIIDIWKEDFADDIIIRALEMSRGKNINYADKILIGWKANGVPLTREEQIAAAANQKGTRNYANARPNSKPAIQEPTEDERELARQILARRASQTASVSV